MRSGTICSRDPQYLVLEQTRRNAGGFVSDSTGSVEELREAGHEVSLENVPYEFQRGGNQMMHIRTRG
jgi:hypothetical protein